MFRDRLNTITTRALGIAMLALSNGTLAMVAAQDLPVDPPEFVAALEDATDIHIADWNNDGRPDIIATSFDGGTIKMWRNDEFGYVESTWPITGKPGAVDIGDIDGNGQVDLIYAVRTPTDRVGVVLNRDSDLLVTVADLAVSNPEDVHLADLDGDGDLDAVTAEFTGWELSWHENVNGDGETWNTEVIASGLVNPAMIQSEDMDRDGDLDLVVTTANEILWIENDLGSNPSWIVHTIDAVVPDVRRLIVADLDGDGETEVAATAFDPGLIAWWDRPAMLSQPWTRHPIALQSAIGLQSGDMDQDGAIDLVSLDFGGNRAPRLWRNDGAGTFTEQELTGAYSFASTVALGDLDLDGDLDIAVAGGNSDVIETIENRLVRSSVVFGETESGARLGNPLPLAMASADLDRDGDLDLVTYDEDGVLRFRDVFDSPGVTLATVGETLLDSRAFGLCDIDGDTDLDVVIGFAGRFAWFENLGIGLPFSSKTMDAAARTTDLMVFDLTGDGDDDVIAFDRVLGVVQVWRNVGPGASWVVNAIDNAYGDYQAMTAGDIDRDGTTEIIVSADGAITAYTRLADIAYQPTTIEPAFAPPHLVAGDFDADGDVDIAGNVPGPNTLRYWTNDGLGGWSVFESDFVSGVAALTAADYDRDGDLDIVGASENFSAVVFTRRTSPNPFATVPFGFSDFGSSLLAVGDFSGDGYPDTMGAPAGGLPIFSATIPGQYTAAFSPAPAGDIEAGSTVTLVEFDLEHLGRPGDQSIELTSISLSLRSEGQPLDGTQMNGLIKRVRLLRVGDSVGIVIAEVSDPNQPSPLVLAVSPSAGAETVLAPDDPATSSAGRFRLEIEIEDQPTIDEFSLRIGQTTDVVAEDSMGTPLTPLPWGTSLTTYNVVGGVLFADGFESGDTSAWTSPGR
jgi:hypothetical protein